MIEPQYRPVVADVLIGRSPPRPDCGWQMLMDTLPRNLRALFAYRVLNHRTGDAQPEEIPGLRQTHQSAVVRWLGFQSAFGDLVKGLGDSDREYRALKGIVLAHTVYPEPAARVMADLDILVRHDYLVAVSDELVGSGSFKYRSTTVEGAGRPDSASRLLTHVNTGVLVEVHGELESLKDAAPELILGLWENTECITMGGNVNVPVPASDDMAIHLCAGLRKDGYTEGLRGVLDLALMIERGLIDPDRLCQRADSLGCANDVRLGLSLAAEAFGTARPTPPRDDEAWNTLVSAAGEELWHEAVGTPRLVRDMDKGNRVAVLWHRFTTHYVRPATPGDTSPRWKRLFSRVWRDVRVPLPRYLRRSLTDLFNAASRRNRVTAKRRQDAIRKLLTQVGEPTEPRSVPTTADRPRRP